MAKCTKCKKELTLQDFDNEEEAILSSPRAFIGEEFSNFCWKSMPHEWGLVLCKKHRKKGKYTMVKIFADIKVAKEWIKDMLP